MKLSFLNGYRFSLILLLFILFGSFLGILFKERAVLFKPLGDIFLNLLFMIVVPLVFFSIASAVAGMSGAGRLQKIFIRMLVVFIVTGIIASAVMLLAVKIFPPAPTGMPTLPLPMDFQQPKVSEQLVRAFTVSDFNEILSKKNMLALIIFSILFGLAAAAAGEKAKAFVQFLMAGQAVMMRMVAYIMLYAPIGLGAYFAYLVGVFGSQLFGAYVRAISLYYPVSLLYFFIGFSCYVRIAAGREGLKIFWINIIPASLTALATGSSVATIPTNLEAARRIGIPKDIYELVIPVGATIHMEGSCLSAIVKIAFLFGVFQMDFSGGATILTAVGVAS